MQLAAAQFIPNTSHGNRQFSALCYEKMNNNENWREFMRFNRLISRTAITVAVAAGSSHGIALADNYQVVVDRGMLNQSSAAGNSHTLCR
jgi:hypothetical protein